jgi:hypothetical protein
LYERPGRFVAGTFAGVWQDRLQAREPYEGLGIGFDGGRDGITITPSSVRTLQKVGASGQKDDTRLPD